MSEKEHNNEITNKEIKKIKDSEIQRLTDKSKYTRNNPVFCRRNRRGS